MGDGLLETHRTTEAVDDGELIETGRGVLEANWLGHATSPSRILYPHQWSWDAACVAIGTRLESGASRDGLRSLFSGQWRDGLLPHIVFTDGARYAPGPSSGERSARRQPRSCRDIGIVQPPIHGSAALQVYRLASDREGAVAFLEELLPKLAEWHAYLYRERARSDGGLVEIWHPWESGMDNSRSGTRLSSGWHSTPTGSRSTNAWTSSSPTPPSGHPTGSTTATCTSSTCSAGSAYDSSRIKNVVPFAIQPVLFHSLLVQSNRDLAEIARIVGADPAPFDALGREHCRSLEETLWDEEHAVYVDYDVRDGARRSAREPRRVSRRSAGFPRLLEPRRWSRSWRARGSRWARPLGDHEPGSPRPGLPACPLLARPDLAHPELGAPARPRPLRIPSARRGRSPRDDRACAKRWLPRALQPRDGSRPGRRGVRMDGSARSRSPERETGPETGGGDH